LPQQKLSPKLHNMMTRSRGIIEWSTTHKSPLKYSKLALIDFAHQNCTQERPPLELPSVTISLMQSTKYLGVYFNQHLSWKIHHTHAVEKGTKWAAQIKHVSRTSWGLTPKHTR
jgi:hypothetical protein